MELVGWLVIIRVQCATDVKGTRYLCDLGDCGKDEKLISGSKPVYTKPVTALHVSIVESACYVTFSPHVACVTVIK